MQVDIPLTLGAIAMLFDDLTSATYTGQVTTCLAAASQTGGYTKGR